MLKPTYTNKSDISKNHVSKDIPILVTFSTCWYIVKSKFSVTTYLEWINNLFSIINNFNLVLYTDISGFNSLKPILITENYYHKSRKEKFFLSTKKEKLKKLSEIILLNMSNYIKNLLVIHL